MYDDRQIYFNGLTRFLRDVENQQAASH